MQQNDSLVNGYKWLAGQGHPAVFRIQIMLSDGPVTSVKNVSSPVPTQHHCMIICASSRTVYFQTLEWSHQEDKILYRGRAHECHCFVSRSRLLTALCSAPGGIVRIAITWCATV